MEDEPPDTSAGTAPRTGLIDNGATTVVGGLSTYKKWRGTPLKTGDTHLPIRSFSNSLFRFGDGRIVRALFKTRMPAANGGYRGWLLSHFVAGSLHLVLADPALGAQRTVLRYQEYPTRGKPRVEVSAPGKPSVPMEVPVKKTPAEH